MAKVNVYHYLGKSFSCPFCLKEHHIPIRRILTRKRAVSRLPGFLSRLIRKKKILVLSDDVTYEIAGKKSVRILRKDFQVSSLVLSSDKGKQVYADEKYFPEIFSAGQDRNAIITVGSGSVTDMGKYVAHNLKLPWISFPTAPSMNAYTSSVAAFLSGGMKVTVSTQPAIGVIIDLNVIGNAPLDLIKAGFADSLAKSFANADWKMASFLTGEGFCLLPFNITTEAEHKYLNKGRELCRRDEKTVADLMEGLNLGGLSMVIAGVSSPASGGEHLISHFLDMIAHREGKKPFSCHGLQVGLGTLVSSLIYERLKVLSVDEVISRLHCSEPEYEKAEDFFAKRGLNIKKAHQKKSLFLNLMRENLPSLWNRMKKEAFTLTYPAATIKKVLTEAKCPLRFSEIGVTRELARQAIMYSRFIRSRLTVLDLADELDILQEVTEDFLSR
ncbi:MAG: sn-glycerol-1-phosphate dehydrogenase [Candidatus Omnitrophota bacterium]